MDSVRVPLRGAVSLFRARFGLAVLFIVVVGVTPPALASSDGQPAGAVAKPPTTTVTPSQKSKAPAKVGRSGFIRSASPTPAPVLADATPAPAKHRNAPFKSRVISVDKAHSSFRVGKKKVRVIHVTADTKLFRGDGTTPAVLSDIVVGIDVRGSLHRADDGTLSAVSLKIGLQQARPAVSAQDEGETLP